MAFSYIPFNLDPPNWQHEQVNHHHLQQQQQQQQLGVTNENSSQLSPAVLPPPTATTGGGGGGPAGSIRSGSLTERARLTKITQPETALKCPRCESTNTKFCYFNNYNLSQPRHFCKTCRRYWTRGGALRNVPVGGGCRRNNKRSSSSKRTRSSKSPIRSERSRNEPIITSNSTTTTTTITFPSHLPPPNTHLSFLNTPYHNFNDFNSTQNCLNFGEIQPHEGDGRFVDQFRLQQMQQFSFFSPLEQHSNLYPIHSEFGIGHHDLENVKVEEDKSSTNSQGMSLQRNNNLGVNQFWTDYNISSNSTSQLL